MLEALFVYIGVGALLLTYEIGFAWSDAEQRAQPVELDFNDVLELVLFFLVLWPIWWAVVTPRNGEF